MLHGSETWPATKENEVTLQRAEMRMVRWMCGVKLQHKVPSKVQLTWVVPVKIQSRKMVVVVVVNKL